AKADESDAVDRAEDVLNLNEAGGLLAREIDLRHVTRNHHFRAEPEPCEEHLHLLRARVLRLVEDDERVVERPAAHERERRHFDRSTLHVHVQPLRVEHVVEGIEEWPQIWIDLREHVTWEKAQPLSRLDSRAREDDARDLAILKGGDSRGHC